MFSWESVALLWLVLLCVLVIGMSMSPPPIWVIIIVLGSVLLLGLFIYKNATKESG